MNKKIMYALSLLAMFSLALLAHAENATSSLGEQHRSRVSNFVQELEKVADRDRKIGEEVKAVAQEEKEISEKVKEKMENIEKRGALRTFLIGSDYKNLGALRSDLVTSRNHIERLNKALERTDSSSIKTVLETQIKDLTDIQTKAEDFAKSMEGKFSLFGWLSRMLSK